MRRVLFRVAAQTQRSSVFEVPFFSFRFYSSRAFQTATVEKEGMQTPKPAASVMVLRPIVDDKNDKKSDYQILMVKRSAKSRFVPHAHVFPGGITEKIDSSEDWKNILAKQESERAEIENPILNFKIAGIRELLEEANIFISTKHIEDNELRPWRAKIQKNAAEIFQLCETFQCAPECSRLIPWCHWVTPKEEKWRYDTFFFLAALRSDTITNAVTDETETVGHDWFRPEEAFEEFKKGNIFLSPPTYIILHEFLKFSKLEDLVAFAKKGRNMSPIQPHFVVAEKGRYVVALPGDGEHPQHTSPNRRNRLIIEGKNYQLVQTDDLPSSL